MCKKNHIFIYFFLFDACAKAGEVKFQVAMKFLTVNLHKTAIPKDLTQNFRSKRSPFYGNVVCCQLSVVSGWFF